MAEQLSLSASAAAAVDAEHRQGVGDLFREHRRQEQRMLSWRKADLRSFARNREQAEQRYVARLDRIERGYQRAAAAVEKRHNSLAGRMERLTRAGRERQEATRQALEDRRARLDRQAARNFEAVKERQFRAEQRERIHNARMVKQFRLDHLDDRETMRKHHAETRDIKVEVRTRQMRDAAEQALRREMQRVRGQEGHRISR